MIGWTMNADPLVCTRLEDNFSMNTSKIICDICGTVYPDTAAACPICGFPQKENAGVTDSVSVGAESTAVPAAAAASRNKGGRFSNKNVKKRNQSEADEAQRPVREKAEKPRKAPRQEAPEIEQEPEEKNNRGLVIIAIILAIAVLLVGGYIISRFIGGRDAYDNPNAPVIGTNPSTETTAPVETEPVETGVPCVGMTVSDASVEFLGINRSWKLSIAATPADTTDELTFTSSDENVVTVTPDGRLTSVGPGTAVITITCGDVVKECQVVCDFEIETEPVETTEPTEETTEPTKETTKPTEPDGSGLKLSHEDVSLFYAGESFSISAKFDGQWVGNAQVTWSSADPEVAKVENGKVTAVGGGYTTISATYNGKTAKCIVRCRFEDNTQPEETTKPTEGNTSTAKWSISHSDVTISVGESFTLKITNEAGETANVTWSASTAGIVNVSGNSVTGAASGMTTLTATVGGQSFSCIVRVR